MANPLLMKLGGPLAISRGAAPSGPPATGLVAWYKADVGVTDAGGGAVSAWADQSGNGYDLTQGVSGNRPVLQTNQINGLPAIQFTSSSSQYVRNTTHPSPSQTYSMAFVGKYVDASGANLAAMCSWSAYSMLWCPSGNHNSMYAGSQKDGTSTATDGSYHSFLGIFAGASSELYNDNSLDGSGNAGTNGLSGLAIGTTAFTDMFMNGFVAEAFVWDHGLDSTERTTLDTYVASRFAI